MFAGVRCLVFAVLVIAVCLLFEVACCKRFGCVSFVVRCLWLVAECVLLCVFVCV